MITIILTIEQISPSTVKVNCKATGESCTQLESVTADAVAELLQDVTPPDSTGENLIIKSNPRN